MFAKDFHYCSRRHTQKLTPKGKVTKYHEIWMTKALVLQKNRYKRQTYLNPFEQSNEQMRIMPKIKCRSSFNVSVWSILKQLSIGVPRKRCPENIR